VLLGSNGNEGTLFFAFKSPVTDDASYLAFAEQAAPGKGAQIVAQYPSTMYGSPKAAAAPAVGGAVFGCSAPPMARRLASALSPHGPAAVIADLGSYHSPEIPFVFANPTTLSPSSPTAEETPLVATMQGYWGRMAKSGDPNGDAAFAWPPYAQATDDNIVLDL